MLTSIFDDTPPLDQLPRFRDMDEFSAGRREREIGRIVDYGSWTSNGVSFALAFNLMTDEFFAVRSEDGHVILVCRGVMASVVGAGVAEAVEKVVERGEGLDDLDWLVDWEHVGRGIEAEARRATGGPPVPFIASSQLLYS